MQELIAGIVLAMIGLVLLIFPSKVFQLTEKWKIRNVNVEMSSSYEIVLRLVGLVLSVIGILVAFKIM